MILARKFSELVADLEKLDRFPRESGSIRSSEGEAILEAFLHHGGFVAGAVWLAESEGSGLRLSATTPGFEPPKRVESAIPPEPVDRQADPASFALFAGLDPMPHVLIPLWHNQVRLGLLALCRQQDESDVDDGKGLELIRVGARYLTALLRARRMADEVREGDFQLKYRLWELESLYDIGLSVASTLDLDDLAEEILIRTISLLNARRAALYLRKGGKFELYRSFGEVRAKFLEEELDRPSLDSLIEGRNPISLVEGASCLFPGCSTLLAVPIMTGSEIVGVVAVADRETRDGGVSPFEENDIRLLRQFGNQAGIALENARLHREALDKQRMERELQLAATIQRDILPRQVPSIEGMDLAVLARPARQLGGDYYTFIERDGGLSLCIADVSGKSIPAAILVSALHAAVHLLFAEGRDLGEIATELNRHIHRWSSDTKFATLILATIDADHGLIRYVNAGHNPGYLILPDGTIDIVRSHGLPIGLMSDSHYSSQTRRLPKGSLMILYSDGITEAEDPAGEEYGNDRLEKVIVPLASAPVGEIRDAISNDLESFVGEAPQLDDQTLVLIRV
ncbi:MAG: PP2C family protein-serine/threonine phosphatase [Thermoanaerobaculia bacterium]